MADELIDIYNDNMEMIGIESKSTAHHQGLWHSSIHCWIVRDTGPGFLLFQKRGADKEIFPNILDITAAGHYQTGEKISDGVREIVEELGLSVEYRQLIPLGIKMDVGQIGKLTNREFCHVFFHRENQEISEYEINKDEVEGLVQIAISDGLALFSGERPIALAEGVEYRRDTDTWVSVSMEVTVRQFIPRIDPYYYKMFILADRLLRHEKHLAI
jgi:isopentenyldiphosphate isomerase